MTLIGGAMLGLYALINAWPMERTAVAMPAWVPFWPATTLPYLGLLVAGWLLPVTVRDPARFRACVIAAITGYLLVAPWWLLSPTTLPRPGLPAEWWHAPYRALVAIDAPNNIRPCAHAVIPAVGAWFAAEEHPRWRPWLVALLALGLPTIATTWQHRPQDIALGLLAAVAGIAAGRWWLRQQAEPAA